MNGATIALRVLADVLLSPITLFATIWVRCQEARVLRHGISLNAEECALAQAAGVVDPLRIRVMPVRCVPVPLPNIVRRFVNRRGWLLPDIAGMTLGYGIFLRSDCFHDRRLLVHELAHAAQYERYGRHAGFLRRYVRECVWPGYPRGPLETEARRAETLIAPTQQR